MFTLMDLLPYIHAHMCACTHTHNHPHTPNEQDGFHYALPSGQDVVAPRLAPQLTPRRFLRCLTFSFTSAVTFLLQGVCATTSLPSISLMLERCMWLDERSRMAALSAILNLEGLFVWTQPVGSGIPRPRVRALYGCRHDVDLIKQAVPTSWNSVLAVVSAKC